MNRPSCSLFFFLALHSGFRLIAASESLTYSAVFGLSTYVASTVDSAGNVYIAGSTPSPAFPVTAGALQNYPPAQCGFIRVPGGGSAPDPCWHAFVARIDPSGKRLIYATYLGGNGSDFANAIAIDAFGNAYVTGSTSSTNFPVTTGAWQTSPGRGFISKLNPDGSGLVFSTYLPGGYGAAIVVDPAGNVFVAGTADVGSFPATPGAFQTERSPGNTDAFVLKLNASGSALVYSTVIGGTFQDNATALALDTEGNTYVAGFTGSTATNAYLVKDGDFKPFPITDGAFTSVGGGADVFVAKLNATGSALVYSSVFGGTGDDEINALAVDPAGNAYFAGSTFFSPDFPTTPGALRRTFGGGFTGKLSSDGSQLLYSTYLGGARGDRVSRILTDSSGHAFVSGVTYSPRYPTTANALEPCFPGNPATYIPRSYVAELNQSGRLIYSSYVKAVVALEPSGHVYTASDERILDLIDISTPAPAGIRCVVNAANFVPGPVAPGELITVLGSQIGPQESSGPQLDDSGKVSTTLGNTRVLFGGKPAPLLYVSTNQINAVVPFALAGQSSSTIEVERDGVVSLAPFQVAVAAAAPAFFTLDGSGEGPAAAINQDGTLKSPSNPAEQGSIFSIWPTGLGPMQPAVPDGLIPGEPSSKPALPLILGLDLAFPPILAPPVPPPTIYIVYAGDASGLVEGIVKIDVRVPPLALSGEARIFFSAGGIGADRDLKVTVFVR